MGNTVSSRLNPAPILFYSKIGPRKLQVTFRMRETNNNIREESPSQPTPPPTPAHQKFTYNFWTWLMHEGLKDCIISMG